MLFRDCDDGNPISHCFNSKLFNLMRLQAKAKVQREMLAELPKADDMAKYASTDMKMQEGMDRNSQALDNYDLTISTKKTEVVHHVAAGKPYNEASSQIKTASC